MENKTLKILVVITLFLIILINVIIVKAISNYSQVDNNVVSCDKVSFNDIKTYQDRTIISGTIYKSSVTQNSESMIPTIPVTSTILYTKDFSYFDLCIGDIIRFNVDSCSKTMVEANKEYGSETTLHRIVEKKQDSDGIYYKTKGDNQFFKDSCKVRLNDIEAVVVGVIY